MSRRRGKRDPRELDDRLVVVYVVDSLASHADVMKLLAGKGLSPQCIDSIPKYTPEYYRSMAKFRARIAVPARHETRARSVLSKWYESSSSKADEVERRMWREFTKASAWALAVTVVVMLAWLVVTESVKFAEIYGVTIPVPVLREDTNVVRTGIIIWGAAFFVVLQRRLITEVIGRMMNIRKKED